MAEYFEGRYLSAEDSKFLQLITSDIYYYLKESERHFANILLFPPILSYYRFLIHKKIEEFPSLISFSIGKGDLRKTIISTQDLIKTMQKVPKIKRPDRAIYVPKHIRLEENSKSVKIEFLKSKEKTCSEKEDLLDKNLIETENSQQINTSKLEKIPSLVNNSTICDVIRVKSSPLNQTSLVNIKLSETEISKNIYNNECNDSFEKQSNYNSQEPDLFINESLVLKIINDSNYTNSESDLLTKKLKKKNSENDLKDLNTQNMTTDNSVDFCVSTDIHITDSIQNDLYINPTLCKISVKDDVIRGGEDDAGSEDSWSDFFNEHGDFLKKEECQQICEKVGRVSIQSPQFNYLAYTPKEIQINDDEFGHLLEVYDFPAELKSEDIHLAFMHIRNNEFDIKWVDDTHAILIFSSVIAAQTATDGFNNPNMKLRPINWASRNTKLKVKKFSGLLLPHKTRPVVVANVARNMVANALGVRLNVDKDILNREKKIIKDARESKKALQKSKQLAWDGFVDY